VDRHYLVIYCTCPDQVVAERIAKALVSDRLAACVNIVPGITSIYRWQGRVHSDPELLLIIKSRSDVYPALEARIRELHAYEVPEIIALPVRQGSSAYLNWLDASLEKPA
jgi:periplasmic divalent cation tolerance protein